MRVNDLKDYVPILQKGVHHGLKISLHFAEIKNDDEVSFILNHDAFRPDRMGHCTFIHPNSGGSKENWNKFLELKIPAEICLTSNVNVKAAPSYEEHHLKYFYEKELPLCICTDDKGVFKKSSSEEYAKTMEILQLSQEDMYNLSFKAIDYVFSNDLIKDKLSHQFTEWKKSCV